MTSPRIRYQTIEFDSVDIHIRSLRNRQEFSDPFGEAESMGISSAQWPMFGVVWEAGKVLGHEMACQAIAGKRILEVGCGMALSSLVLNARNADITATDYHPEAGAFLAENVRLNEGKKIPFLCANWDSPDTGLGKFDLIIGADILYERPHIDLLSTFIDRHANPECEVVLVDPGRGNHAPFSKRMVTLGYSHSQRSAEELDCLDKVFKGQVLSYKKLAATD